MYVVYLLQSESDGGFYIGFTTDIDRRLVEHENGLVDSTKNRRPVKLVYYETYEDEGLARKRELNLKNFGSSYVGLLKRLGYK